MKSTDNFIFIVSEINNFAYYKASGGCARILQGNMPLSAAKIRRSKRQNEKSFVVYYNKGTSQHFSLIPVLFYRRNIV